MTESRMMILAFCISLVVGIVLGGLLMGVSGQEMFDRAFWACLGAFGFWLTRD